MPAMCAAKRAETAILNVKRGRRVVALTGANSFVGRHLVGALEEDPATSRIVVLDVESPPTAGLKTRFYKTDLTRPAVDAHIAEILNSENVDALVHMAFLSSPTNATAWAHELESVGTMHVLNAARERALSKFVLMSTTSVYSASPSNPAHLPESYPLRSSSRNLFVQDKIEAEAEARRFAADRPNTAVTVLRLAPLLGPTVKNYITRWLSRRMVPTLAGFDPLVQYLHELDGVLAFKLALDRDVPGTFNVVADGVLPISTVVRLAGRSRFPMPGFVAARAAAVLWGAGLLEVPASFLSFLKYPCVADGSLARRELGFRPVYSTPEAVLDFGGTLRLRDARLLGNA